MQTEKTQKAEKISYNAFGTPVILSSDRKECFHFDGIDVRTIPQFGLELDKETGSTVIVEKDPLDLYELIQSYKDQCGMEFVQKLITRGLASPDDFAAQPIDYGDSSQLADNINDAYQQAMANEKLGVDLGQFKTAQDIDNYIIAQVKAQLANAKSRSQSETQTQTLEGDNK